MLLERRPDIQHLPLTCENTNTPLPYIDLVNETLEYFVANDLSLDGYTGHDTDDSASAGGAAGQPAVRQTSRVRQRSEGRALPAAAAVPPAAGEPAPLLRQVRGAAAEAMEALRTDDALERASDAAYGWRDILMEELELSRAEYRLLTDRDADAAAALRLRRRRPATPTCWPALPNAKAFARRVGISYEELVELLRTRFVNPNSTLIPGLERLGVPFATLEDAQGRHDHRRRVRCAAARRARPGRSTAATSRPG